MRQSKKTKRYVWKLFRNSLILGFAYMISNLEKFNNFDYGELKPLIVFVGIYVLAELTHKFGLGNYNPKVKMLIL